MAVRSKSPPCPWNHLDDDTSCIIRLEVQRAPDEGDAAYQQQCGISSPPDARLRNSNAIDSQLIFPQRGSHNKNFIFFSGHPAERGDSCRTSRRRAEETDGWMWINGSLTHCTLFFRCAQTEPDSVLPGSCLAECDVSPGNKRLSSLPLPGSGAAQLLIGALIREGSGPRDPRLPGSTVILGPPGDKSDSLTLMLPARALRAPASTGTMRIGEKAESTPRLNQGSRDGTGKR
ncbi:unnamed protein product [Pleuronectes platessa]|uniref:Uncharacterized protein n=1 Tax=Pleuronectes platessa TaxID=8262 RepID=A0A9N7UH32_PLEPL|nr:unnamed protein product [Pleuronectes platessa]